MLTKSSIRVAQCTPFIINKLSLIILVQIQVRDDDAKSFPLVLIISVGTL